MSFLLIEDLVGFVALMMSWPDPSTTGTHTLTQKGVVCIYMYVSIAKKRESSAREME